MEASFSKSIRQNAQPRLPGRRKFLWQAGLGFVGSSIGYLFAENGELTRGAIPTTRPRRAESVIFLFMCGGVSHIDTFDPKGNKWAGKMIDCIGFGDNQAKMRRPIIPCHRTFTRHGQSGIPVSDWFPHVGSMIDDIAVVRSMYCHESNHFPAVIEGVTGHRTRQFDQPSLGGWVSYALGSSNRNLPTFVNIGRPSSPVQLDSGFLGPAHAATPFGAGRSPVENLSAAGTVTPGERKRQLDALEELGAAFRQQYETERQITARIQSYELAAGLQLDAPEAVDFRRESPGVRALYGVDEPETDDLGRQLLLARRLAERGVRFVQVCHAGGGNGRWDAHSDIKKHAPLCRQTDKPIAGLLQDLKNRGMLESTLVVWATEFGRSPWSQNTKGRDHNPRGFTCWLAGGGVKGGVVHGSTDEFGFHATEGRRYISDLQATLLDRLGLDYRDLEVDFDGQPVRLVEEGEGPIGSILT
jgi:hypothetical protein